MADYTEKEFTDADSLEMKEHNRANCSSLKIAGSLIYVIPSWYRNIIKQW